VKPGHGLKHQKESSGISRSLQSSSETVVSSLSCSHAKVKALDI